MSAKFLILESLILKTIMIYYSTNCSYSDISSSIVGITFHNTSYKLVVT